MAQDAPAPRLENCFCIGCGYPLRELASNRCPECGRAFDPADPRTMSVNRPLRKWQRWLLKPLGWQTIALALVATMGLIYLSRWPRPSVVPWSVLLSEFSWPLPDLRPLTLPDYVFYSCIVLWLLFLVLWSLRHLAKLLVPRTARRAHIVGADPRRRKRALGIAAVLSVICIVFGWQDRVGRRWIARAMSPHPLSPYGPFPKYDPWRRSPVALTPAQAQSTLTHLTIDLPTADERRAALFQLVEMTGRPALPAIVDAQSRESDETLLVWELRLIGLCRDPSTVSLLTARLHDSRLAVRAAAADALGILRQPSYPITVHDGFWIVDPLSLDTQPPVDVAIVVSKPLPATTFSFSGGPGEAHELMDDPPITLPPSVRDEFLTMMTTGATSQEREAAARALVAWPPDQYRLRVAEWGVWINNGGNLSLARSVIDEIPPFVHRTGNPISDFDSYLLYPSMVTKPIIHLTSDRPVAVDLEVHISEGRPWFAYPLPDDFAIGNPSGQIANPLGGGLGFIAPATNPATPPDDYVHPPIASLSRPREGYPWLIPHHRIHSSGWQGNVAIYSLGIHWQSLIVCPQQQPWMTAAVVSDDAKYQWWKALRDVPSSWIGQRGEAERFLYYDGPTRAAVPVNVALEGHGSRLRFTRPVLKNFNGAPEYPPHSFHPMSPEPRPDLPAHEGLYIEVRSGAVQGQFIPIDNQPNVTLYANLPLQGDAVVQRFRKMLLDYGLTGPEAEGLVRVWTPQFFHTEGRRFILRMSPEEYAKQCPIEVKPAPTEMVRLGLVLSEFDPKPAPERK